MDTQDDGRWLSDVTKLDGHSRVMGPGSEATLYARIDGEDAYVARVEVVSGGFDRHILGGEPWNNKLFEDPFNLDMPWKTQPQTGLDDGPAYAVMPILFRVRDTTDAKRAARLQVDMERQARRGRALSIDYKGKAALRCR